MKKRLIALAPYFIALGLNFYLLPLLMRDTGAAMVLMLCVMPAAAFVTAVDCGVRRGFTPLLPLGAAVLFLPTVFIHYSATAWVYSIAYGIVVLAGVGLGGLFYGKR